MRKPQFEFIPSANEEYLTARSLPQALPELVKHSRMIGTTALLLLFFLAVGLILIAVLLCRSRSGIRRSKQVLSRFGLLDCPQESAVSFKQLLDNPRFRELLPYEDDPESDSNDPIIKVPTSSMPTPSTSTSRPTSTLTTLTNSSNSTTPPVIPQRVTSLPTAPKRTTNPFL